MSSVPTYKVPGQYTIDGITFMDTYQPETMKNMQEGNAPKFDLLVVTPPRSGIYNIDVTDLNIIVFEISI